MLTVVKPAESITLDNLWHRAMRNNMRVEIDSHSSYPSVIEVCLHCGNKNGSRFTFKGTSTIGLNEAFLKAFDEAKIIGLGYE